MSKTNNGLYLRDIMSISFLRKANFKAFDIGFLRESGVIFT